MSNIGALQAANADADQYGIGWIMVRPGNVFRCIPPEMVWVLPEYCLAAELAAAPVRVAVEGDL